MVEDAANDNRIVRGIVVAEAVAGPVAAPGHLWAGHQAMEKSSVELFEYGFQVVTAALGRVEMLPSAYLAHQVRLPADVVAGNVTAIAGRSFAVNRPAVHLGQQDMGDGFQNSRRGGFQQVREPHQQLALTHPDGVLDGGESEEFNLQFGDGRVRTELAVLVFKDLEKNLRHVRLD